MFLCCIIIYLRTVICCESILYRNVQIIEPRHMELYFFFKWHTEIRVKKTPKHKTRFDLPDFLKAYLLFILLINDRQQFLKNVQSHQSMIPWHHYLLLVHQILCLFTYSRPVGERKKCVKIKKDCLLCSREIFLSIFSCQVCLVRLGSFLSATNSVLFLLVIFFGCVSSSLPFCLILQIVERWQKPVCHRQRKGQRANRIDRAKMTEGRLFPFLPWVRWEECWHSHVCTLSLELELTG